MVIANILYVNPDNAKAIMPLKILILAKNTRNLWKSHMDIVVNTTDDHQMHIVFFFINQPFLFIIKKYQYNDTLHTYRGISKKMHTANAINVFQGRHLDEMIFLIISREIKDGFGGILYLIKLHQDIVVNTTDSFQISKGGTIYPNIGIAPNASVKVRIVRQNRIRNTYCIHMLYYKLTLHNKSNDTTKYITVTSEWAR